MKKKIALILTSVMIVSAVPMSVFAAETNSVSTAKVVSPLTIAITPNLVDKNINNFAISDIVIKEAESGILTKNKSLYFKADNLKFKGNVEYEVISGNIKIRKVSTEKGVLKIDIDKSSSGSPSEIKISNLQLYVEGSLPNGEYPLNLITEESYLYPDNIFGEVYDDRNENGKFDISSVTVIDNFVTVDIPSSDEVNSTLFKMKIKSGDNKIIYNDKIIELDEPAYVNDGYLMVPVRVVTEAMYGHSIVIWDESAKSMSILIGKRIINIKVGSKNMTINGSNIPISVKSEIKNGSMFLNLKDLGYALGLSEDSITWDENTNTATLN